jgi:hypothetical protein
MKSILKWGGGIVACSVAAVGLLAAAMWVSSDVRYRFAYLLVEHFDLNPPVTIQELARQTRTLKAVTMIDPNGKPFDWNKSLGAIVWINEWANWCVPYRLEFANMAALRSRVGKDKLRIVLLSQPKFWDTDKHTAQKLGLDFELVTPRGASAGDLAAINLSKHANGFLLPENSFMRAGGERLAGYRAPRP